jgi:putative redox protein
MTSFTANYEQEVHAMTIVRPKILNGRQAKGAQGGSKHTLYVDADLSPIACALNALISCSQATAQLVARDLGLKFDAFEFVIKADLGTDFLGQRSEGGNQNSQSIEINAVVETDTSDELFEQFRLETERRFPIEQLFCESGVNVTNQWSIRRPINIR